MSTQNVNVAHFARNLEWDFFCDFQTPWSTYLLFRLRKDCISFFFQLKRPPLASNLLLTNTKESQPWVKTWAVLDSSWGTSKLLARQLLDHENTVNCVLILYFWAYQIKIVHICTAISSVFKKSQVNKTCLNKFV